MIDTQEEAPRALRETREALGWSQSRLGDELRVPKNTIAKWERGDQRIAHPTILLLALDAIQAKEAARGEAN